jgi:hypothetical protein
MLLGTDFVLSRIHRVLGGASSFAVQEHKKGQIQTKWAKFTYVARQTKFITKLFKKFNLKVSIKTKGTVGKLLTANEFNKCGLYHLTCHDCDRKLIGQTGQKLFLCIPHPLLSKNVPINMGPKVNRFRDIDCCVE